MPATISVFSWMKPCMPWMPASSIFAYRCFRGQGSGRTKSAVKLHTLAGSAREHSLLCRSITDGKVHEVNILDVLLLETGAIYIMDRGYLDFERLFTLNQAAAFFIIRSKSNTELRRLYSRAVDKSCGLRCDQIVVPAGFYTPRRIIRKNFAGSNFTIKTKNAILSF